MPVPHKSTSVPLSDLRQKQGVNVGGMLVSQFDCGERVFEIADHLVCSAFDLVEVDSVAAWPGRRGEGRL